MGLFKKKDRVIDLRGNYKFPEKIPASFSEKKDSTSEISAFGFMDNSTFNSSSNDSDYVNLSENSEDKKTKLAKRLLDMTNKIEDLSNQIYHMRQRLEIIEKKLKINYD